MTTVQENITRLKIENTDVFLEELGESRGKLTVSDTYGHNYSTYWGAMGCTLKEFICRINSDYFANNLMGYASMYEIDIKATFAAIRKHISNEIGLHWYNHIVFQKDMREKLKTFQNECKENVWENYFVDKFLNSFIDRLDFYLIEDKFEREYLEKQFKNISEWWCFIHSKPNRNFIWLQKLHSKLKKELNN